MTETQFYNLLLTITFPLAAYNRLTTLPEWLELSSEKMLASESLPCLTASQPLFSDVASSLTLSSLPKTDSD